MWSSWRSQNRASASSSLSCFGSGSLTPARRVAHAHERCEPTRARLSEEADLGAAARSRARGHTAVPDEPRSVERDAAEPRVRRQSEGQRPVARARHTGSTAEPERQEHLTAVETDIEVHAADLGTGGQQID